MTGSPRITIRLPGDLHDRVHAAAKELGVDVAGYVRVILDQATRSGVLASPNGNWQPAAPAPQFQDDAWSEPETEPEDFDESALRDEEALPSTIRRVQGSAKAGGFEQQTGGMIRSLRAAPKKEGKDWAPNHRD